MPDIPPPSRVDVRRCFVVSLAPTRRRTRGPSAPSGRAPVPAATGPFGGRGATGSSARRSGRDGRDDAHPGGAPRAAKRVEAVGPAKEHRPLHAGGRREQLAVEDAAPVLDADGGGIVEYERERGGYRGRRDERCRWRGLCGGERRGRRVRRRRRARGHTAAGHRARCIGQRRAHRRRVRGRRVGARLRLVAPRDAIRRLRRHERAPRRARPSSSPAPRRIAQCTSKLL
jgi:hypothetical protein